MVHNRTVHVRRVGLRSVVVPSTRLYVQRLCSRAATHAGILGLVRCVFEVSYAVTDNARDEPEHENNCFLQIFKKQNNDFGAAGPSRDEPDHENNRI